MFILISLGIASLDEGEHYITLNIESGCALMDYLFQTLMAINHSPLFDFARYRPPNSSCIGNYPVDTWVV